LNQEKNGSAAMSAGRNLSAGLIFTVGKVSGKGKVITISMNF